jgi:hypothetical protein
MYNVGSECAREEEDPGGGSSAPLVKGSNGGGQVGETTGNNNISGLSFAEIKRLGAMGVGYVQNNEG